MSGWLGSFGCRLVAVDCVSVKDATIATKDICITIGTITHPSHKVSKQNKQTNFCRTPSDFPTFLQPCHVSVDRESVKDVTIVTKYFCITTGTLTYPYYKVSKQTKQTNLLPPNPLDFPTFLGTCHVSVDRESVKDVTIVTKDICITIYGAVAFLVQFVLLPAPYNSAEM